MLISAAVMAVVLVVLGSWRGSSGLPSWLRSLMLALRVLAVASVFLLLFNPGSWKSPTVERLASWALLVDTSSSMTQGTEGGNSRAKDAAELVRQARDHAKQAGVDLRIYPFSSKLGPVANELPASDGKESRILPAVSQLLHESSAAGDSLAGVMVLSDGRQTLHSSQADLDSLGLRARSREIAVHTVAIGTAVLPPDLALIQPRATLTAFAGQPLKIPFALKSTGLSPLRSVVVLRDATGAELANKTLELPVGETVTGLFEIAAPAKSCQWTMETPVLDREVRSSNNRSKLNVRILESKTRVFLAEGAPYWDSKFLAQLLRQQAHVDIRSVHRISDQRYFRVDSGSDENEETTHPVFPDSLKELEKYDLIVFGKNVDAFLTPDRISLLRAYVRDHGGAVLFARGKPTTGEIPAFEPLEPVVWASASAADFRFMPNRDGEASGLFGEALPNASASIWTALPSLKDGRQVTMVKPFARVLADGVLEQGQGLATQSSGRFPALVVRRYGQGVTGLVNGDGLWRWDFYPEARELGNCYEDFWTQLIQWMASYSEFMPGQDFSMRLPSSTGELGVTMAASISYRGSSPAPQPMIRATSPSGESQDFTPAAVPDPSGRMLWRATFTPDQTGSWTFKLLDPRTNPPPTPEAILHVPAPPEENDDLSPDAGFLRDMASATGGGAVDVAGFGELLRSKMLGGPPPDQDGNRVWDPAWDSAFAALAIAALLATEWFLRRRNGLA